MSGFGAAPVKDEGAAITYDDAQEAYTARYTHETIALGFSITEEAVEDNLYDSSRHATPRLWRVASSTPRKSKVQHSSTRASPVKLVATASRCSTLLTRW